MLPEKKEHWSLYNCKTASNYLKTWRKVNSVVNKLPNDGNKDEFMDQDLDNQYMSSPGDEKINAVDDDRNK